MRYLGSKDALIENISTLIHNKGLDDKKYTFFDAFCGMGAVADAYKNQYNIIINDILTCCTTFTQARLQSQLCTFEHLGFDPFIFLNENIERCKGFMYLNYSPGGSNRMYFTAENASRIDYFREQIEIWHLNNSINTIEYNYLLGCLLESVSKVSNTAGVYGAFLKHWDNRALKDIAFNRIDSKDVLPNEITTFNDRIENIIHQVDCDILYLDPPYTQNQYGTQYHLLETLVLNDTPSISRVTGSRPVTPMRSDWSKEYYCHVLFEKVIAKTTARYIIFSYNNDGIMSKDYIEMVLKRYGIEDTYECQIIDYKKYNNTKSRGKEGHNEYLFYIEKKVPSSVVYDSPLNYQGSKTGMIELIRQYIPDNIETFIDAFGGGFNVGINIDAKRIVYNDINHFVYGLIKSFRDEGTVKYLRYIATLTKHYKLSTENKEGYLNLRLMYNSLHENSRDAKMLYTLLLYGFQQQIRFNTAHEFNNPFGSRYFNDKLLAKFISFCRISKEKNILYECRDYHELMEYYDDNTVIYFDPPYRNASGTYNDGKRGFKGWSKHDEEELFVFLQQLTEQRIHFMLSYIINDEVVQWAVKQQYQIINVGTQGRYNRRHEVIITNYQ